MNDPRKVMTFEAYRDAVVAVLTKAGFGLRTLAAESWVSLQWERGTALDKLLGAWNAPENLRVAQETKAVQRMEYVKDELTRKYDLAVGNRDDLASKLKNAALEDIADLAADNVESLVKYTARVRVYGKFMKAIETRESINSPAPETYEQLSAYAYREVAVGASHQTRSTSWQANVTKEAELAASGEVAALFVDVTRT